MASRSHASSSSSDLQQIGSTAARPVGHHVMSESEIQAYLAARDTVRRVRRSSSLFVPPQGHTLDFVVRCRTDARRTEPDEVAAIRGVRAA